MTTDTVRVPRQPGESVRLGAVCRAFADAGVDAFDGLRSALAEADRVEVGLRARQDAAHAHEKDLVARLVAGQVDVDGVAVELAAAVVPGLEDVVRRAVVTMGRQMAGLAAREAQQAFDTLGAMVAAAVAESVAVGRRVVDVDRVVRLFSSADYRSGIPPLVADAPMHPDWPAAVRAAGRVSELRKLSAMLPQVGGPSSSLFAPGRAIGEWSGVADVIPDPLVLAVASGLGWAPGLHPADDRVGPDDGGREARRAVVEQSRRAAPLQSVVNRLVGR